MDSTEDDSLNPPVLWKSRMIRVDGAISDFSWLLVPSDQEIPLFMVAWGQSMRMQVLPVPTIFQAAISQTQQLAVFGPRKVRIYHVPMDDVSVRMRDLGKSGYFFDVRWWS